MKVLVLTLALGLVCAQEDITSEEGEPQIIGSLHTFYLGASDQETIEENHPMRGLLRRVEQSPDGKTFSVKFYTEDDGECNLHNVMGSLADDGSTYSANYAGKVDFQVIPVKGDFFLMSCINVNEEGKTSDVIGVFGSGNEISMEVYEAFLELAVEKNIPIDNIIRVRESDTCPEDTN